MLQRGHIIRKWVTIVEEDKANLSVYEREEIKCVKIRYSEDF